MIEKITEFLKSYAILISEAHQTKLTNLRRKERLRSPGIITNLSNKALTIAEQDALPFGLNHILPRKFQENNVKANIERFIHGLKQKTKIKLDDDFKDEVKFLFKKFASNAERAISTRYNSAIHRTLGALSKDKSIKICKQGKGNGVVILNSNEYFKKLDEIILDQTKFVEVVPKRKSNIHPLISRETSIGKYIRKCLKKFKSETVQN